MKISPTEKIYALILVVIFGGIVLHAPLTVFFGTLVPDAELVIKAWKEILMLLCVPLAAMTIWRRRLWTTLVTDRLLWIGGAYIALHMVMVLIIPRGLLAVLAGLAIDLRYIVYFGLVYILVLGVPALRGVFLKAAAIGAAVVVGFATLQTVLPPDILTAIGYSESTIQPYLTVDQNPDFIRINSTLRGPNPLGAYAVIVIGLLAAFIVCRRVKLGSIRQLLAVACLALGSLTALWASYSRSAQGAAFVTVGIVAAVALRRRISRRVWIGGAVVACAIIGGLVLGRENDLVSTVVLHDDPDGGAVVSSNEDHFESLENGFGRMLRQPLGGGIGSTGSASLLGDSPLIIENQYLFIAHEVGWLGVILFLLLLGMIFMRLWHNRQDWPSLGVLASGIGLLAIGLVLPVWVDDTVSIVWWGLAAVALTTGGRYGRQPSE